MPTHTAEIFAPFAAEHHDFIPARMAQHRGTNRRIFHQRRAQRDTIAIGNHQYLIKTQLRPRLRLKAINDNFVIFGDFILLATRFYHSIHLHSSKYGQDWGEYTAMLGIVKPVLMDFCKFMHRGRQGGKQGSPCQNAQKRLNEAELRRGGRVVECAGLENRYGQKPIEGSNPSLSASTERRAAVFWCLCWG